jgi:hypothetical protein
MITSTFEDVLDGSTVIAKRLTLFFNGKFVCYTDFLPETEMSEDDRNVYIANKFSGLLA